MVLQWWYGDSTLSCFVISPDLRRRVEGKPEGGITQKVGLGWGEWKTEKKGEMERECQEKERGKRGGRE